jgi:AcrR family transcriptional regulator
VFVIDCSPEADPMCARPRTVEDDAVFAAVDEVVARRGVTGLSLAAIGEACGLSAAALVQRFGGREALLAAFARSWGDDVEARFEHARSVEASPLLALVEGLAAGVRGAGSPQSVANRLGFLHLQLADDELRGPVRERAIATGEMVRALLAEAADAGEIDTVDPAGLARTVLTTCQGALVTWATLREGTLEDWLRDELEGVLAPYLRGPFGGASA